MDQHENGSGPKVGDQAKKLDNLNKKRSTFLTPLNFDLNAVILALKDSAKAFVSLLSKQFMIDW